MKRLLSPEPFYVALLVFGIATFAMNENAMSQSKRVDPQQLACVDTPTFVSQHCAVLKPTRIVVVTTRNFKDQLKEQDAFAAAIAKQLNKSNHFSAVLSNHPTCADAMPLLKGRFDELEIMRLSKKYRADAVLYCRVNSIDVLDPMSMQASMVLIHAGESIALVCTDHSYDLSKQAIRRAYATFAGLKCEHADDILLHSPSKFIDFAAERSILSLLSVW